MGIRAASGRAARSCTSPAITIEPAGADADDANGNQAAVDDGTAVKVTVRSADGLRTRTYVVNIEQCLTGIDQNRLSIARFQGGGVDELLRCARLLDLSSVYHVRNDAWTAVFLDAPAFLGEPFRERFSGGIAGGERFVVKQRSHFFARVKPQHVW